MLYENTRGFFDASQEIYGKEKPRETAIKKLLAGLIGEQLSEVNKLGVTPDGMIIGNRGTCCVLVEMKNEIGAGGSDLSVQAAVSYSKFWGDDSVRIHVNLGYRFY